MGLRPAPYLSVQHSEHIIGSKVRNVLPRRAAGETVVSDGPAHPQHTGEKPRKLRFHRDRNATLDFTQCYVKLRVNIVERGGKHWIHKVV